jgi:hypothetical protein
VIIEQRVTQEDGYLTIIDPDRGIGLVCEPLVGRPRSWRVISLFIRMDKPETAEFVTEYGKN